MKKAILSIALAACAAFTTANVKAQTLSFGVKGGLNITRLTNWDNSGSRASVYAGGFVNFAFNDNLSLQPELLYSGQGNKYDVLNGDVKNKINYINIPVMVQYRIVPEFYLEAGPQFSVNVAAKVKSGSVTVDYKDEIKGGDFGLGFGLGYQFPIGVGVSARYMFGLSDIAKHNNDDAIKNSVASVGAFYTFKHKVKMK